MASGPRFSNGTLDGGITDPELMARWTTMSAFFGWCRNHYDGYNKQYQEPYAYGVFSSSFTTCSTSAHRPACPFAARFS